MIQQTPLDRIESFRLLIKKQTEDNDFKLLKNQESLKNIVNPEITKKNYTIMNNQPAKTNFKLSQMM